MASPTSAPQGTHKCVFDIQQVLLRYRLIATFFELVVWTLGTFLTPKGHLLVPKKKPNLFTAAWIGSLEVVEFTRSKHPPYHGVGSSAEGGSINGDSPHLRRWGDPNPNPPTASTGALSAGPRVRESACLGIARSPPRWRAPAAREGFWLRCPMDFHGNKKNRHPCLVG